jgi:hypothetical protein
MNGIGIAVTAAASAATFAGVAFGIVGTEPRLAAWVLVLAALNVATLLGVLLSWARS